METIDDLIYSEFAEVGYSVIGEIAHLPVYSNEDNSDFWLIMDDYDIDVEYQKNLAETYGNITDGFIAAAKNTSVLVLKKVESMDEVNKNWAVAMENDKFFFKKYVLLYTDAALNKLNNEILVTEGKSLSNYLVDPKVFENLKKDSLDGAYALLYGIAHKLPFLLVEMEKSKLELAYPTFWSTSDVLQTNDWVNAMPEGEDEIGECVDEILNSLENEQD